MPLATAEALARRDNQVSHVKGKVFYQLYIQDVPIDSRQLGDPVTPPSSDATISLRRWKAQMSAWDKALKRWCAAHYADMIEV